MAKLCVTVGASSLAELRRRRDEASGTADLVEVRLDSVRDPDGAGAVRDRPGPVVVTCRPVWEGGHFSGSEEERLRLLESAWRAGADFVDVEWKAWPTARWRVAAADRTIVSSHDFDGVPPDLQSRHRAMHGAGVAVVKLAVHAHRLADCLSLRQLSSDRRQVLLAMGVPGLVTRAVPGRFGSAWTYAGDGWAPGQVPAARLRDELRFGQTSDDPRLFGLVANPVGHSVSPAMHNAALAAAGLDAVYLPFQAADVDDFLALADALGVDGASVTTPFKVEVLGACEPDPVALEVGAVNTLVRRPHGWTGFNTDVAGLIAALDGRLSPAGQRASVLGTGGAARAAIVALRRADAIVTVRGRRADAAAQIADALGVAAGVWPPPPASWDLLVNATSAGMHPRIDETPLPDAVLDGRLVYDLVYNPGRTRLLQQAKAAGCQTLGGLEMLVAQAAEQFMLWTGQRPDSRVMRQAAERRLTAFATEPVSPSIAHS
jgi:3-dehydroquinate dehydratase/shikimate dehydrogenase